MFGKYVYGDLIVPAWTSYRYALFANWEYYHILVATVVYH